jgi:uncharacterized membrane protein
MKITVKDYDKGADLGMRAVHAMPREGERIRMPDGFVVRVIRVEHPVVDDIGRAPWPEVYVSPVPS